MDENLLEYIIDADKAKTIIKRKLFEWFNPGDVLDVLYDIGGSKLHDEIMNYMMGIDKYNSIIINDYLKLGDRRMGADYSEYYLTAYDEERVLNVITAATIIGNTRLINNITKFFSDGVNEAENDEDKEKYNDMIDRINEAKNIGG